MFSVLKNRLEPRHLAISWAPAALIAVSGLMVAPAAQAKEEYYAPLEALGTCLDCRLCHSSAVGNAGTVDYTKQFLVNMMTRKGQEPLPDTDSDGDGFTDLQELAEYGDPNNPEVGPNQVACRPGGEGESAVGPEYGCLRVARAPVNGLGAIAASVVALALLLTRRRRG